MEHSLRKNTYQMQQQPAPALSRKKAASRYCSCSNALCESAPPRKQEDWLTEEISAFYSLRKPELQVKLLTFSSDITLPTVSFVATAAIATSSLAASS
jgi:hypothetical protein